MNNEIDKTNDGSLNPVSENSPVERLSSAGREEVLESMLENTRQTIEDQGFFPILVNFVKQERLPSAFSYENVSELVRFVVNRSRFSKLPIEVEDCVSWIANCIYDDPISNSRTEKLWQAIVSQIQDGP